MNFIASSRKLIRVNGSTIIPYYTIIPYLKLDPIELKV